MWTSAESIRNIVPVTDSTAACLGAGELRGTDDRASTSTGADDVAIGTVERKDRVAAGRSARAFSHAARGNGNVSCGRALVTGAPSGRLRRDGVRRMNVDAGGGELRFLGVGGRGSQRNGLELAWTV